LSGVGCGKKEDEKISLAKIARIAKAGTGRI
jgi:hypothetical protein